jgi:anaerobic selenocysteine-containing dehydrogenase
MSYFFHKFIVTYNATKSTNLVKFFNIFLNILNNPAFDPIAKIPEFKVCAVKIEKVNH